MTWWGGEGRGKWVDLIFPNGTPVCVSVESAKCHVMPFLSLPLHLRQSLYAMNKNCCSFAFHRKRKSIRPRGLARKERQGWRRWWWWISDPATHNEKERRELLFRTQFYVLPNSAHTSFPHPQFNEKKSVIFRFPHSFPLLLPSSLWFETWSLTDLRSCRERDRKKEKKLKGPKANAAAFSRFQGSGSICKSLFWREKKKEFVGRKVCSGRRLDLS